MAQVQRITSFAGKLLQLQVREYNAGFVHFNTECRHVVRTCFQYQGGRRMSRTAILPSIHTSRILSVSSTFSTVSRPLLDRKHFQRQVESSDAVLQQLVASGYEPTDRKQLNKLLERRQPTRIEREKRQIRNRIQKLCLRGQVEEALDLFSDMLARNLYPELVTFNNLIAGLGRRGEVKRAFKLFNELKKRALLPSDHTYTSMFNACAEAGPGVGLQYVDLVRGEMDRRAVTPNTHTCNALIKAYVAVSQPQRAFEVYSKMSLWNCEADLKTFSFLLMACTRDKADGLSMCVRLWGQLEASGLAPDMYTFNLLLCCLRDAGIPNAMLLQPLAASESVLSHSPDSGNAGGDLVGGTDQYLGRQKRLQEVHVRFSPEFDMTFFVSQPKGRRTLSREGIESFLAMMMKCDVQPTIKTFGLLSGLLFEIPSSGSHFMWRLMHNHSVKPDVVFMNSLVAKHSMQRDVDKAQVLEARRRSANSTRVPVNDQSVLSLMRQWGLRQDASSFKARASGCWRSKDAQCLFETMTTEGVPIDAEIFEILLKASSRHGQYSHMTSLLKKMKQMSILPSAAINRQLSQVSLPPHSKSGETNKYVLQQFHGFKGYLSLWRDSMGIPKPENEDPDSQDSNGMDGKNPDS